ncbi:MAG: hypothetical protein Tsb0021_18290 [Chlamydiales bacterium]
MQGVDNLSIDASTGKVGYYFPRLNPYRRDPEDGMIAALSAVYNTNVKVIYVPKMKEETESKIN